MVVDDQEETLISTRMLLEREGHRVLTAASATEALAVLRTDAVDLLLADYFMPGMDGEQMIEAIRRFNRDVQIVLQTGYSGEKPPREMMRLLDIQGYHDKTDGPDRLLLWVEAALKASRQLRQVKDAQAELLESQEQLRRLSSRLLTLQEEERGRISRELHDQLGQLLTAIGLNLDWSLRHCALDVAGVGERLRESKGLVQEAIRGIRELCASLRADELHGRGLAASLRAYAIDFERYSGLSVNFSGPLEHEKLDAEVTRNVYRMVQEALANVVHHAKATTVAIDLRQDDNQMILSIADDGRGFEPGKVSDPKAIGLIGMRERARLIGATMALRSAPGVGTRILLNIPVNRVAGETATRQLPWRD